jgi:hypothetical protein
MTERPAHACSREFNGARYLKLNFISLRTQCTIRTVTVSNQCIEIPVSLRISKVKYLTSVVSEHKRENRILH